MADLKYYDILFEPITTEATMNMLAEKKYCFYVHPEANKIQVKEAVEKLFDGVKVKRINIMNLQGKTKKRGRIIGKTVKRKKSIIFLSSESKEIELFKKS